MGMIRKIFISYARSDGSGFANDVYSALKRRKSFVPWLDTEDIARGNWRSQLEDLALRVGCWPLLLKSCNGTIRSLTGRRMPLSEAIKHVGRKLKDEGISALDPADDRQRDRAVAVNLELSLSLFDDRRERYLELAIFPEDEPVPLEVAAELWNFSHRAAQELAVEFDDASLAEVTFETHTLKLHDVFRPYARLQLGKRLAKKNLKLLSRWPDVYHLPHTYAWNRLSYHLQQAGEDKRLHKTAWRLSLAESQARCSGCDAVALRLSLCRGG